MRDCKGRSVWMQDTPINLDCSLPYPFVAEKAAGNCVAPSMHGTHWGLRVVKVSVAGANLERASSSSTPALTTTTPENAADSVHRIELHRPQKLRRTRLPLSPGNAYVVGSPCTSENAGRGTTQLVLYVVDVDLWQFRQ